MLLVSISTPLLGSNLFNYKWTREVTIYAPAVAGSEYSPGVLIKVDVVVAYPGSGKVFFQAQPLTQIDTQATARIAAVVAADVAEVNFYDYDYYITMSSNSIVVGGPSAGAIMTIAILSLLLNHKLRSNVTMTGMINPDGTIGPVGGLKSKLEAAAKHGFKVFLIPYGQRVVLVPNITTIKYPWGVVHRVEYTRLDLVEYGKKLGVKVVEVASIREAYSYFTGYNISYGANIVKPVLPDWFEEILEDIVANYTSEAMDKVEYMKSVLDEIHPFYRGAISSIITEVENGINESESLLNSGDTILAANKAFTTLCRAIYGYWLAKVLINESNIDVLAREANETLNNVGRIINTYIAKKSIGLSKLDVLIAITSRYTDAVLYYNNGVEALGKNDIGTAVSDFSYTISRVKSIHGWLKVLEHCINDSNITMDRVYSVTLFLYGLTENIVSYAYSLSQDIGSTPNELNEAIQHMDKASEFMGKRNETIMALGEIVNALACSIASIHDMFTNDQQTLNMLATKIRSEVMVSLSRLLEKNPAIILPQYYVLYGDEVYGLGEPLKAITIYILASIHAKVIEYCRGSITGGVIVMKQRTQTNTSTPTGTATTSTTSSSGETEGELASLNPGYYFIVGLAVGVLVGVLMIYVIRNVRKTNMFSHSI